MLKYILFIIAIGTLCCCKKPLITVKRSSGRTAPANVIYPPEKSITETMQIGDTIDIFYKQTGWHKSRFTNGAWMKLSFYSMETIWRVDTAKYLYTTRWAYPDKRFGKPLEFDSLKNHPDELYRLLGRLEFRCYNDTIVDWNGNYESCIRSFNYPPSNKIFFSEMNTRELTSPRYQVWRFYPPSREVLNQWRAAIPEYSNVYRYEMITISKDTVKISYSDEIGAHFALVFPK